MNANPISVRIRGTARKPNGPFWRGWILVALLPFASVADPIGQGIRSSKHNLSASSPGTVKSVTETEICITCHTPHTVKRQAPLWNHQDSGAVYTPYTSSTKKATIGQPTGASKLCLSCHDGTIAMGMVQKTRLNKSAQPEIRTLASGAIKIGPDLSDDHPISFTYDSALVMANGQLRDPASLTGPVHLDANKQVQCTSCHSAHDNKNGKFLVQNNYGSTLCMACHNLARWDLSVHKLSTKTWNGVPPNPWSHTKETTVLANGCENCHRPHSAGTKARLLNYPGDESNCYPCHNGNVTANSIQKEFNKTSVHPITFTTGVHDPMEDAVNATRHVTCVDCHNPHAVNAQTAKAPLVSGSLAGVKGVTATGARITPISREYELCFRCHADSPGRGAPSVQRQFPQTNTRLEFGSASGSYHPVVNLGKNPNVPSLISPWTTSSLMYCTDCHNNNTGPGAGGNGAKGPHGSTYAPILERRLELTDNQIENSASYALCYKCHSRASILSDQSFKTHNKHITTARTACTTCHDSHGVAAANHLINFNTLYVTKSSGGRLEFVDNGTYRGTCYLTCHGKDHNPLSY
ncbi:MAG: cytochrome c3 family protein [Verrucomicrobiota bacterium]